MEALVLSLILKENFTAEMGFRNCRLEKPLWREAGEKEVRAVIMPVDSSVANIY